MAFLKYLTRVYHPRTRAMLMPWPDVNGSFTCYHRGAWRDLRSMSSDDRMQILYPLRSDLNRYLNTPERVHAVIFTGSTRKGDWSVYSPWRRDDYLLTFTGSKDPVWFDPKGYPYDMPVSWKGLTHGMRATSYGATQEGWSAFVETCNRLIWTFDHCGMPDYLYTILTATAH